MALNNALDIASVYLMVSTGLSSSFSQLTHQSVRDEQKRAACFFLGAIRAKNEIVDGLFPSPGRSTDI